ncbi:MAG: hypothetical protein IJL80_04525 [Treponema sp.]|nr:hypothetical protein [Treponema sp.]
MGEGMVPLAGKRRESSLAAAGEAKLPIYYIHIAPRPEFTISQRKKTKKSDFSPLAEPEYCPHIIENGG